ncbi:hypothetical protein [Streptomyces goshikiensis]|uniref:hypothetical protein n=1 Tax=Streptomyces goshikiensis TaxID=1942 RepID=UPI0037ABCAF5
MRELRVRVSGVEWEELADLADACGGTPEEWVAEVVRERLRLERARVGVEAGRLAGRHAALLKRLGE